MRRLLLLGGMTPDVTVLYHNTINRAVRSSLGGRNNAPLYIFNANLEEMIGYASSGNWERFPKEYIDATIPLTGAIDRVVVCAILAHKVARQLSRALEPSGVPLLHIGDFLARHLRAQHPEIRTLGLLGPKVTLQGADDPDFLIGYLQRPEYGYQVLAPETEDARDEINRGMLDEVSKGAAAVTEETRAMFIRHARALVDRGANVIILGSTDLGFIVRQEDLGPHVAVVEPAPVHAQGVSDWALSTQR